MGDFLDKDAETGGAYPVKKLDVAKVPGHWLLARLGKRVLRPGGLELTRRMLESLDIELSDDVVEFAPGLGATAQLALSQGLASYIGVERDEAAARMVCGYLRGPRQVCRVGSVEDTGLPEASATVVYGEAMLTMQRAPQKRRIVREAHRLLAPSGRYGIHELCLVPDGIDEKLKEEIRQALSGAIHVGARPLSPSEWRNLLEAEGFEVLSGATTSMRLLEPGRLVQDEGLRGTLRFARNILRDAEVRRRVLTMRGVFRRYREHLGAIALVAVKEPEADGQRAP